MAISLAPMFQQLNQAIANVSAQRFTPWKLPPQGASSLSVEELADRLVQRRNLGDNRALSGEDQCLTIPS